MPINGSRFVCVAALATGVMLSGCATEKYVDEQVATVSGRIESVSGRVSSLEREVQQIGTKLDGVDQTSQQALRLAQGKLVLSVISESDFVTFDTGKWKLTPKSEATLATVAERLKSDNKDVFIEIYGHADPRGSVAANRVLAGKRALEVRRYLAGQGIPLRNMEIVSWGEERSSGKTAQQQATDRKVVLRVLG